MFIEHLVDMGYNTAPSPELIVHIKEVYKSELKVLERWLSW